VYISIDISNLTSLSQFFSNNEELTSANFTKEVDITNIRISDQIKACFINIRNWFPLIFQILIYKT